MEAHSAYMGVVRNWRPTKKWTHYKMISNYGNEIANLLIGITVILWFFKIGFHFSYLKSVNNNIKETNFISFFLKPENFTKTFLIVAPFFTDTNREANSQRKRTRTITFILWIALALTFIFLIKYPPTGDPDRIYIDLRN
ncbi:MAG: hypothetical protein K8H85_07000 [Cyclobacteriaceae bacterium]|nr:hypothetical protein [Cyclobacteriaceae bacterium]